MKIIHSSRIHHSLARVSIFLIMAALIAGMAGCDGGRRALPPSENLEIQTWYDLDDVRNNLAGNHTLMNSLNSTTPGYEELASPTANEGKGWQPIEHPFVTNAGTYISFSGTFDGQGYEIRDLFINRPAENGVGLFSETSQNGVIKDLGVTNVTVTGAGFVGGLVGSNSGSVINSYSSGSVTGEDRVGGLAGSCGGTVFNSYSSSNVAGHDDVGGLVGVNWGNVGNSYSTANVTGHDDVGGLLGEISHGFVDTSYSSGSVTGDNDVGGLVGKSYEGHVYVSFWDTQTSGQVTSDGGTGKNTTEMQDIDTFSVVGWNIIAVALNETNPAYIWNIVNDVTYPFLSWHL